ncbi:hypothetical protein QC761_0044490 [Podospora bellae-mahoneyi]|uniref:Uncharacterized protein n=1 Tax=Podospora bellae-mahoneyi TaxID=2093777 RepID=A0ABR0FRL2_9PEZI|nr:hypothetical protein QC761_0044490 [Podospora bellae-mahoneyi]
MCQQQPDRLAEIPRPVRRLRLSMNSSFNTPHSQ